MRHLSDEALQVISMLVPPGAYFVVIVATAEGTGVDTNILDQAKAKAFVLETGHEMATGGCTHPNLNVIFSKGGRAFCPDCKAWGYGKTEQDAERDLRQKSTTPKD